jgi:hypothetical protein
MDVIVQIEPATAHALHGGNPTTSAVNELHRAMHDLGLRLEPLHPGTTDPYLAPYFVVVAPDPAAATRAAERLLRCQAVTAAYVKPPDALPE